MKKLKDQIARFIYKILIILVKFYPAKSELNHLLVIKHDELGDYIIFRNLLKAIRESEKYKEYKITLVGNVIWQSVFFDFDKEFVDDVIWIKKKEFNKDLKYRISILKKIRVCGSSEVINFIFTRDFTLDDGFAFIATGETKIAMKGNNANISKHAIKLDALIYSKIIDSGNERLFDSIRNQNFLSQILNKGQISIDTKLGISWQGKNSKYLAIFIGAGNPERRWPIENFVKCSKYAWEKYGLSTIVLGGKPDEAIAGQFVSMFNGEVKNLAGKTSLSEVIQIFNGARFAISTDTGPLHIAVAAACPVIGLFSGKYYRRYSPYPKEITSDFYPVYPDFIDNLIAVDDPILYDPFKTRNDTIKFIETAKILPVIDQMMLA